MDQNEAIVDICIKQLNNRLHYQQWDDLLKILVWGIFTIIYRFLGRKIIKSLVKRESYLDLNTMLAKMINRLSLVNISSTLSFWYWIYILELNAIRFEDYKPFSDRIIDFGIPLEQHNLTMARWDLIQFSMVSLSI